MNIKQVCALAAASLLFGAAGSAAAADHAAQAVGAANVLPVLVNVDDQGQVSNMLPAYQLRPEARRLLRQALDNMITAPAQHDGHAVSSQFVINLAMQATPLADGKYNVKFVYVSAQPVPFGSWHWYFDNGHRLALSGDSGLFQPPDRRFRHVPRHHVIYHPIPDHPSAGNGAHQPPSKP